MRLFFTLRCIQILLFVETSQKINKLNAEFHIVVLI